MHCFPVKKLRIFDVAHVEDSGQKLNTLLSMEVDGVRVYSLTLPHVVKPASCENTVAMFKTTDRRSICAWLDPISKECFVASELSLAVAFFLCHMAGLITGAVAAGITGDKQLGPICGVAAAAICGAGVLWRFRQIAEIKTTLRSRYSEQFGASAIQIAEP